MGEQKREDKRKEGIEIMFTKGNGAAIHGLLEGIATVLKMVANRR